MAEYAPLTCDWDMSDCRPCERSLCFRLATLLNRRLPRGKGAVPRFLGRNLGKPLRYFMTTRAGNRLAIEPGSFDMYASMMNEGGVWSQRVFEVCASLLSAGRVFFDIGANVGYLSIEMAGAFADAVRVVAFEPQPALAQAVAASARINGFGNVSVFELMLGDRVGAAELFLTSHSGHASAKPGDERHSTLARRIVTLDQLVESGVIPAPDVIKIDVEGAEYAVLSGARETLARHRPSIVFESNGNEKRFGYSRADLLELVGGIAPYEFHFIDDAGGFVRIGAENLSAAYEDILARPIRP